MPTYEYACTECGEQLEVVQSFTDDALTVCPACKGKLRKVFSPVGVVFKGSGFYKTDSRAGKSNGAKVGANGDSAKSSESGGDSSSTSSDSSGSGDSAGNGSADAKSASGTDSGASKSSSNGESKSGSKRSEPSERSKPRGDGSKVA